MKHPGRDALPEALFDVLVFQYTVDFRHEQRGSAHRHAVGQDQARGQFDDLLAGASRITHRVNLADVSGADEQRAVLADRESAGVSQAADVLLDLEARRQADFGQVKVRVRFAGGECQHRQGAQRSGGFPNHVSIIHRESEGQKAISSTAAISTSRKGRLAR